MQHVVCLEEFHESRCSEDNHDGIHLVESVITVVDGSGELFGSTRCEDINRVGNRRSGEELRLKFFGSLTRKLRHLQSAFRQGIGEHDSRTACMGDDGETAQAISTLSPNWRQT